MKIGQYQGSASLLQRARRRGLAGSVLSVRKRMQEWFPQDAEQDPIASKVFALRLQRLGARPGVTIGDPDFVHGEGASQVQTVQTLLSRSQWSEEVRDTPPAILLGDVKVKLRDQWGLINVLNALRVLGHTTVTVAFREDCGMPVKAALAVIPAGLLKQATVVLFGFYGRNYRIRDQILCELCLFDRAEALAVTQRLLGPNESAWLPVGELFPDIDPSQYGDLRVEIRAYHPQLAQNPSPENRFFLILESPEGTACACVHSTIGFSQATVAAYARCLLEPGQRDYVPKGRAADHAYLGAVMSAEHGEAGLIANSGTSRTSGEIQGGDTGTLTFGRLASRTPYYGVMGFWFMRSPNGTGLACWHDGHRIRTDHPMRSLERQEAFQYAESFPVVFHGDDPLDMTLILDREHWSSDFSDVNIALVDPRGVLLVEIDVVVGEELRTLEVYSALDVDRTTLEEGSYVRLAPRRVPAGPDDPRKLSLMCHVCYSNAQGIQDVAHSNTGTAYIFRSFGSSDRGSAKERPDRVIARTNKWAPYGRTARLEPCIHVIHGGVGDAKEPLEATARLFLDDGQELLSRRKIPRGHSWTIHPTAFGLDATELFRGVLCLECDYANLSGFWTHKTRFGHGAGIDHLTGS